MVYSFWLSTFSVACTLLLCKVLWKSGEQDPGFPQVAYNLDKQLKMFNVASFVWCKFTAVSKIVTTMFVELPFGGKTGPE